MCRPLTGRASARIGSGPLQIENLPGLEHQGLASIDQSREFAHDLRLFARLLMGNIKHRLMIQLAQIVGQRGWAVMAGYLTQYFFVIGVRTFHNQNVEVRVAVEHLPEAVRAARIA